MAVQAFFIHGVLCAIPDTSEVAHNTYYTGGGSSGVWFTPSNAAPDVPEYVDHAAGDPSAPMESANNLKQIAIAVHALDAGGCSVDICGQNSPITHAGWGPWEVVLSGHGSSAANTGYVNPASFQIVSAGADAASRLFVGNLAVHSEAVTEPVRKGAWIADVTYEPGAMHSRENAGGSDFGHADMLFGAADPSLSEHLEIAWVSGDGGTRDHGNDVAPITNLTGVDGLHGDHGISILEFSVENFPNNSPDPTPDGFGIDRGHVAGSFELTFATQTTSPQRDGNAVATESLEIAHEGFQGESEAVTWTTIAMAESGGNMGSYNDYSLYDLIV
jgi:hypothetical protein